VQPLLQWKSNEYYAFCVCFVALSIHHAMRMRHLSPVACPAVQYFSTLSHKRHDFRKKKVTEHKMCLDFFQKLLSETFLSLRRTERDVIKMYIGLLHVKCRLFLSDFNETRVLSTGFRKIIKFHENLSSWGRNVPCGRTDRHDEADSCFTQLCEGA